MDAVLDVDFTGHQVSHYAILGVIGAGGMGKVYLGRDERLQRHVAIKVLIADPPADSCRSRGLVAEARLLSRLSHPNVAAVYDFIEQGHREYIVMEFVPGPTLSDVIAAGPLPTEEVLRLGLQMARGIAAAHAARVVHRDLKPQNIKVTSSGRLKILDFGLGNTIPMPLLDSWADTASDIRPAGTLPYMSPEQLRGDDVDERTDIFSAGAVLYEMASGRRAFPQRNVARLVDAIQHQDPPPLSWVNPFVPRSLERIVSKALQKDRSFRQPRASTLAAELRALRLTIRSSSASPSAAVCNAMTVVRRAVGRSVFGR